MKWQEVQSTPEHEVYHLLEKGKKQLQLVFSPTAYSVRIDCNNTKRVFFIRREGFRRNRIVIRNEYGIKMGEFGQENKQAYIIVNNEKLYYTGSRSQLVLFREGATQPHTSCDIEYSEQSNAPGTKSHYTGNVHPGLLMSLCWYLFLPLQKEMAAELAVS